MRANSIVRVALVLLLAVPLACAEGAPDVHGLAKAVDEHYNRLRSLQAEFTETYSGAGVDRTGGTSRR